MKRVIIFLGLTALTLSPSAWAAEKIFNVGTTTGNWSIGPWSPAGVPGALDNAYIKNSKTAIVNSSVTTVGGYVYVGQGGTSAGNGSLTIQAGAVLNVSDRLSIGRDGGYIGRYSQTGGTVSADTMAVGDTAATDGGSSTATISGGTLTISGNLDIAIGSVGSTSGLTLSGTGYVDVGGDVQIGGNGGANIGSLTINGGTMTVAGTGIYEGTGTTTSTLTLNGASALLDMTGNGNITVDTLTLTDGTIANADQISVSSISGNGTITGLTSLLTVTTTGANTFGGTIEGDGGLTKAGTGSLLLTGASSFDGTVNVNGGTLRIQDNDALGSASGNTTVASGAALELQSGITVGEELVLNGGGVGGAGALRNISGNNDWTERIDAQTGASAVRITSDAGTLTISSRLNIGGANDVILGGAGNGVVYRISQTGNGGIFKEGAGTWIMTSGTANNTYLGNTTIANGTLQLGTGIRNLIPDGTGRGNVRIQSTGTFDINGRSETINGLEDYSGTGGTVDNTAVGAGTLTIGAGNTTSSFSGIIKNTGGALFVNKTGNGTVTLTGNNSYSGATTINSGTLQVSGTGQLSNTSGVTISGGVLDLAGSGQISSLATVSIDGGTLRHNSSIAINGLVVFGASGGTLGGTGTVNQNVTVGTQAHVSPGNSVGQMFFNTDLTLADGGTYVWEINDATGGPGTGWDFITVGDQLDLSGLSLGGFTIDVNSLSGTLPGLAANFDLNVPQSFNILYATNGFVGTFSSDLFTVQTSSFLNGIGSWVVVQDGNFLQLNYAKIVPEPTTLVLLGLGGLLLFAGRRMNKSRAARS